MNRAKRTAPAGATCPKDPTHGPLLEIDGRPYCPHQSHDAERIRPAVRRTTAEAAAVLAAVLGPGWQVEAPEVPGVSRAQVTPEGLEVTPTFGRADELPAKYDPRPQPKPQEPDTAPERLTLWS